MMIIPVNSGAASHHACARMSLETGFYRPNNTGKVLFCAFSDLEDECGGYTYIIRHTCSCVLRYMIMF